MRHILWIVLIAAAIAVPFMVQFYASAQVQGDQLRLFSTTATAGVESASFNLWHNGTGLPPDWKSPIDWSAGPIYWRVKVTNKKTSQALRMSLVFEKTWPDGRVGMEEISDLVNKPEITTNGQTVYAKLDPLSAWNLNSWWQPWAWDKPINGIYSFVWAWDETKNDWVWFAGPTVCAGYDFCYKGSLKQADHLPVTIQSEAFITQAGKPFVPPAEWAGCPWPECSGGGGPQPTNPPQVTQAPNPTTPPGGGACPKKANGDADCNGTIAITDYAVWRFEFRGGCSPVTLTAAACGDDKDGDGNLMDTDFNTDGKLSLVDFQLWRNSFN